jgi:hypothetical protein
MRVMDRPLSGKELCQQAVDLCDRANDNDPEAKRKIAFYMANPETQLHTFFAVTPSGLYVLTEEANYESTRGEIAGPDFCLLGTSEEAGSAQDGSSLH